MHLNEYQEVARRTAQYPRESRVTYPILGLCGEAGELANKYKKVIRGAAGDPDQIDRESFIGELGDVLWYIASIASDIGVDLDLVAQRNCAKLAKRLEENTIGGSGDSR